MVLATAVIASAAASTSAPAPQPKGLAGVGLTAEQVNRAVERGSEFLWKYLEKEDLKGNRKLGNNEKHLLCSLALVHANAHHRFADLDTALRQWLANAGPDTISSHRTYDAGLLCMLVESYGDTNYIPKLRMGARYLLETQRSNGGWTYGERLDEKLLKPAAEEERTIQTSGGTPLEGPGSEGEVWRRATPVAKGGDGDASNTQYAILGLNSASRAGIRFPTETWKLNLEQSLAWQHKEGGFCYNGNSNPYGSMTCAGICAVAIARHWMNEPGSPMDDPAIQRGLAWLDANFSVTDHPKSREWHYYYLYSLERVGRILDTELVGSHEWYPLGARYLVDAQSPDGSWKGKNQEDDPRLATSFALLFLTRATPSLNVAIKRGGNGTLKTTFIPRSSRLYIILDASGSMLDEMGGKMKIDIAREAVSNLVQSLPDSTEIALRVYGSRKRAIEPGADADTQLEIPLAPLDCAKFTAKLNSLRARGKTPLARSLREAAADLQRMAGQERMTVLLLTDGGEDTQPRQDPLAAAAELGQVKDISLQILGFDINREDWSQQLAEMARLAHAQYWPAAQASALQSTIRAAVLGEADQFVVTDKAGKEVARGKFGESLTLPEGKYSLKAAFAGQPLTADFWINTDGATSVVFDARKITADAITTPRAPESPSTASPPANTAKFCAQCGKPIPAGAKFCPSCGTKVE